MPFTFAHPAIVLPLNYLSERWVSFSALVIGSMTPDFEYYIRMKVESKYSHTLPGLFWFDLPLGLLLFFVYQLVVKNALIDNLPSAINKRLAIFKTSAPNYPLRYLLIICISVLIGAFSHLLWDSFTHPGGYFVSIVPVLSQTLNLAGHQVYFYKILQHLSTAVGTAAILFVIYKLPVKKQTTHHSIIKFWLIILFVAILATEIRLWAGLSLKAYGNVIVTIIGGGLAGLIISSFTTKRSNREPMKL